MEGREVSEAETQRDTGITLGAWASMVSGRRAAAATAWFARKVKSCDRKFSEFSCSAASAPARGGGRRQVESARDLQGGAEGEMEACERIF